MKRILLILALMISGLGLNAQKINYSITSESKSECCVSGYEGSLGHVTIPSTVTSTSGKTYTVTSIGRNAFSLCRSLTSIEIPSSVTSIGGCAFYNCESLTSVIFGDNSQLTSIGEEAFYWCRSLTSVTFGDNSQLTSIGDGAFYSCSSLTSIEIPSGVTSIGGRAFTDCSSLTSVIFGDNSQLTSIGDYAFEECSSLISIEIPSGVTSIGEDAFRDCSNLRSVICHAENVPAVYSDNNPFSGCPSDMVIYVPANSGFSYAAKYPWNIYTLKAIPTYCEVTVAVSPDKAGIVTGAGLYEVKDAVTVTATANPGYKFVNWTEEGKVVSEEAEYTFVIKSDRNLVANFELLEEPEEPGDEPEEPGDEPEEPGESISELIVSFNIYPNPVNDKLNIITEVEIEEVVVYDVYGRQQSTVNGQQSTVDVSDLNSGVYFVMIKTNEGVVTKRFVKE